MTSSHLETTAAVAIATRKNIALTHRTIEALKPEAAAYRVPDLRCPGLALRVAPSGYKSWDVAFRIRGAGKVRRLSLGPFPAVGLNDARTKTNTLVSAAKNGRDIVQEEKVAKAVADDRMTVEQLVELYVQRMVRGKLKTASQIELRLNRVLVSLRGQFVDEVRRRDLRKILDAAADRGVVREAEQQRQVVRCLFRWALGQDLIEVDPSAGLTSYGASPRRDRVLTAYEITAFWHWLDGGSLPPDYADALRLQLATGARIGEIGGIHAAEVDRETWIWTLPAVRSKNGRARLTPLVGIAKDIVATRLIARPQGPLFTTDDGSPLTSNCIGSMIVKRRKQMPLAHFTSHDLRRTVATGIVDLGLSFETAAIVLGHDVGGKEVRTLIRHYVRSDMVDRKRAALEAWVAKLAQMVAAPPVVPPAGTAGAESLVSGR